MKTKKISRSVYAVLIGVAAFTASFLAMANSVHAVDFSASFSPAADAVEQDANAIITISFDRAIYVDAEETVFTSATLGDVVSLHTTNADGTAIPFTASIDASNTEISIDSNDPLANGAVHVAISDAYYDGDGAQGDAVSATFFVAVADPTPPAPADPVSADPAPQAAPVPQADTAPQAAPAPVDTTPSAPDDSVPTDPAPVDTTPPAPADPASQTSPVATVDTTPQSTPAPADPAPPADTTPPTVTFSPASGATTDDAGTDITLTFSEAVYMDNSESTFDATALAEIILLKSTDAEGVDIPFTASMSSDNTEATIKPSNDLTVGVVYVKISNGYYDATGNQGTETTNSFTIEAPTPPADTTPPTATFSPANGASIDDADTDIEITFSEAVYMDTSESTFDATALASIITIKNTDVNGVDIPFTASMSSDNTEATIKPSNDLTVGAVYVEISNGYYDAAGNQGTETTNSFTVEEPVDQNPGGFVITSTPEDDEIITDNTAEILLVFNQPIYRNSNQAPFTTDDLASFVVLRTDDVYGYGIPFEASMSEDNMIITIDPLATLRDGAVYVAISEDYYSADKTRGVSFKATFSVDTGAPQPLDDIFSYLLTSAPAGLGTASSAIINTPSPSIEASEEFREMKIQEALTLLQQALELLAIVAIIDDASPTAPALPIDFARGIATGRGEVDGTTESSSSDTAPDDTSSTDTSPTPADATSADTPVSETPSADAAPVETAPTDTASADTPTAPPSTDTPAADIPAADTPAADTSSSAVPEAVVVE